MSSNSSQSRSEPPISQPTPAEKTAPTTKTTAPPDTRPAAQATLRTAIGAETGKPAVSPDLNGSKVQSHEWTMESRVGRTNQRYSPNGDRLVAGVVPLSADKTRVLIIQSARRAGWVLPKGGWELDEDTPAKAACREAWEEAGVICTVTRDLGLVADRRSEEKGGGKHKRPRASYHFFEVEVQREEECWPEGHRRRREWVGYERAREVLSERPELLEALERSSIVRR